MDSQRQLHSNFMPKQVSKSRSQYLIEKIGILKFAKNEGTEHIDLPRGKVGQFEHILKA